MLLLKKRNPQAGKKKKVILPKNNLIKLYRMPSHLNIVFMGTPEIAAESLYRVLELEKLGIINLKSVYTKPPVWNNKKKEFIISPTEQLAKMRGIKVRTPERLKDNLEETDFLKSLELDLIIIVAFGLILPSEIIKIPKYGVLNLHPSLLPDLRGPSPIHYAILKRMKFSGISIMAMDAGIDTGPVAAQQIIEIDKDESYSSLYKRMSSAGSLLLSEVIATVFKFKINMLKCGMSQDSPAMRFSGLTKQVRQEDLKVDFFTGDPLDIYAKCRAFTEAGSAYFIFKNKNVKIIEARLIVDEDEGWIKNECFCEAEHEVEPEREERTRSGVYAYTAKNFMSDEIKRVFGYCDYAGCFSDNLRGELKKITFEALPGTIVTAGKQALLVSTVKKGVYIHLLRLKPEGKNAVSYLEFINGFRIKAGDLCR